ncbi:MAG: hypothetical protein WCF18_16355 [Chthoniobacteraceae bacterium]
MRCELAHVSLEMTQNAALKITSTLLTIALFVIVVGSWYLRTMCSGDGRESSGDKHEWSILQSLQAGHPEAISDIQFTQHEDYRIISLPSVTGERLWIMLNPQSPPYYKQMPARDYDLSEEQYWHIVRTWQPISTVDECLSSHVRRTK